MGIRGIAVVLGFSLALPAYAVNKCTARDGSISFQDAPCASDSQTKEAVRVREQGTISSAGSYGVGNLDLSGSPDQRFARLAAAIENLADLSSDCKIKLQVYGRELKASDACLRFTTHHQAWWAPSVSALSELMKSNDWAATNLRSVERVTRHMDTVRNNTDFIALRLQALR